MTTDTLITTLKARFEQHMHRHPGLDWRAVERRLAAQPRKLDALVAMETTGGEPDVVVLAPTKEGSPYLGWQPCGEPSITFIDCSKETPGGRRSLCYDPAAQASRKVNAPADSALGMAHRMGVTLLDKHQYIILQQIEPFDVKTSSWLLTPEAIRAKGGALFGDRRYDHVFVYHNGADAYYAVRGFRAWIEV